MRLGLFEYVALAAGALVIALAVALGIQTHKLDSLRLVSAACVTDRANFADTQKGNLAAIDDLQHRLAVLVSARRVEQDAAAEALAVADAKARSAAQNNAALAAQLEALYAQDAGARAWGDTGVDAGVAASLPKR